MFIKNLPRSAELAVAAVVAIAMIATTLVVAVNWLSEDDWHTNCTEFTSTAKSSPVVEVARQALLSAGNDPVLALEVADLDTCATVASWKGDLGQPTASVVKLLITLDLLQKPTTSSNDESDIRALLTRSDDRVASRLWQERGGPAIVTRQAKALNLHQTRPPVTAGEWGATVMSASDVSAVYRHIVGSLDAEDRELIISALTEAPRNAADGFDQYFGIPDGLPSTDRAVKQGWGSADGRRVLNSTGLVRSGGTTYAVTLMSTWRKDVDWNTAKSALTKAAKALSGAMGG